MFFFTSALRSVQFVHDFDVKLYYLKVWATEMWMRLVDYKIYECKGNTEYRSRIAECLLLISEVSETQTWNTNNQTDVKMGKIKKF